MSILTKDFKTQTILQPRQNPTLDDFWGIAIDIGYSSVKIFSPNVVASFPSFAKKVEYGKADNPIGTLEKTNIAYRDEKGNEYFVGASAQDSVGIMDSDSSTANLYVQNRYYTPEFKVIARVGLALGMIKNQYGNPQGKTLCVQTGLPPEYIKTDTDDLVSVLAGQHDFSIKLGSNDWMSFSFYLDEENIMQIMPQPMGTLTSICVDRTGGYTNNARKYSSSNALIFDPGFGTLDTFEIKNSYVRSFKTWSDLGMKRVLEETAKEIYDKYNQNIPVPAMQKLLGDGYFRTKGKEIKRVDFADILEEASRRVCNEALSVVDGFYNRLEDKDYLIVTGGTGAAWFNYIKEHYAYNEELVVISGAENDSIPPIFSNVRGYYMKLYDGLKKRSKR